MKYFMLNCVNLGWQWSVSISSHPIPVRKLAWSQHREHEAIAQKHRVGILGANSLKP